MAKLTLEKRRKIENLVLRVYSTLDRTGRNSKYMREFFKKMSDAQFEKWIKEFEVNPDSNFYMEVIPYENEPTLKEIEEAAKITGTQLHQYVYFRHDGSKDDPIRTKVRVPVGYTHVRALQQILEKKTSYSVEAQRRNQLTGQLSGADAVGRLADEESYALQTVNAQDTLNELLGPRADNRDKRLQMYQAIERDGFVSQQNLKGDLKNQPTLNYLNILLLGAGLKTDLVDTTEFLRVSAERPQL